jgi:hypothetical protein
VEWDPRLGISSLIYGNEIYGKIITYLWIIGGIYGLHNTYEGGCAAKYDIFFIPSHDIEFTSHLNDYNSSNNLLGSHANGYYMNFVL